jgi:hypothetical protein
MDKPVQNKFTPKGKVKQLAASIIHPENAGLRFIVNIVGQSGKFESKLGLFLAKRWGKVREDYKSWFAGQQNFKLGSINTSSVASDTWIVHLLCEDKAGEVSESSLDSAVKKLGALAKYEHASVHISTLLTDAYPTLMTSLERHLTDEGVNFNLYSKEATDAASKE